MSDRFDQASSLVAHAKASNEDLSKAYKASLADKHVSTDLKIEIKGVLENLRSALDYCAREICDQCCGGTSASDKVYFPIAQRGAKQPNFRSLVGRGMPGLLEARADLVTSLESLQEFAEPQNGWLPDLATLCNENKHEQLTPQTRSETRELKLRSGGSGISLGGNSSIHLAAIIHDRRMI